MPALSLVVALRKESVDRNSIAPASMRVSIVALRKESVDRNLWWGVRKAVGSLSLSARRAWIEIGSAETAKTSIGESLSARRAWIEIPAGCWRESRRAVALRKESVDRNYRCRCARYSRYWSLSARRAWIEISCCHCFPGQCECRSPQGERG